MNTMLWVGQVFLAVLALYSGFCKSLFSEEKLVHELKQTGVEGLPQHLIRFIGICQLLAVAGFILPVALNVLPILTPVTAFLFGIDTTMAAGVHIQRKEYKTAISILLIALLSFFIAAGRFHYLNIV